MTTFITDFSSCWKHCHTPGNSEPLAKDTELSRDTHAQSCRAFTREVSNTAKHMSKFMSRDVKS